MITYQKLVFYLMLVASLMLVLGMIHYKNVITILDLLSAIVKGI